MGTNSTKGKSYNSPPKRMYIPPDVAVLGQAGQHIRVAIMRSLTTRKAESK